MEKEVLRAIAGIDIFPVVSLIIFFVFFVAVVIYAFRADKNFIAKMSSLPLEKNDLTPYPSHERRGEITPEKL
ncbi:MAG TPA: hypothetical protein VI387_09540 [Candidatus Brocadiales bacterium]|nr:hypothetical protein [Candidatus Brocadiales bacterium]